MKLFARAAPRGGWRGFGGPPRGSFSYRRGGGTKSVTGPAAPGALDDELAVDLELDAVDLDLAAATQVADQIGVHGGVVDSA